MTSSDSSHHFEGSESWSESELKKKAEECLVLPLTESSIKMMEIVALFLGQPKWDDLLVTNVMRLMSLDQNLTGVFDKSVQVREGYTLGTHTRMFFNIFEKYISSGLNTEGLQFFRRLFLLHDIGKPNAIEVTGLKKNQHIFTEPFFHAYWKVLGGNDEDLSLAISLMHSERIGEYMMKKVSLEETANALKEDAASVNVPIEVYMELLECFYFCDAGSYTFEAMKGLSGLEDLLAEEQNQPDPAKRYYQGLSHMFSFEPNRIRFVEQYTSLRDGKQEYPRESYQKLRAQLGL